MLIITTLLKIKPLKQKWPLRAKFKGLDSLQIGGHFTEVICSTGLTVQEENNWQHWMIQKQVS